jgi:hypothetical protein
VTRIVFTDTLGVDEQYAPVPASKCVPAWYKQTPEYVGGQRLIRDGNTPHTVKKCVPVFDAMTAGYIIRTYVDVQVTQRDGLPFYEWPLGGAISFHPVDQAPEHPARNGAPYPKWTNPWAISTPRGYSCLFVPPMHNPNGIFTIMSGVVDTDTYTAPVNFPFVMDDVAWDGLIPAGTPLAQVIPFRRDDWTMRIGDDKDRQRQAGVTTRLRSLWFNSYKRQFWTRKQYR